MNVPRGETADADPITMPAATAKTVDSTAIKVMYKRHLALPASNATAISIVEFATNRSIGALSMAVAL
jgi:hypothetical protein